MALALVLFSRPPACAVGARVEAAAKAFGALRRCLFASSSVSPAAKAAAYEGVVLAILPLVTVERELVPY